MKALGYSLLEPSLGSSAMERTSSHLADAKLSQRKGASDRAAREFEAFFLQFTLKEMRKTVQHSELFGEGNAARLIESMFDEALAKQVAEGPGIGLADRLRDSLGQPAGEEPALASIPSRNRILKNGWRISSRFGDRIHPVSGGLDFHDGVDIAVPQGTPVHATARGKVTFAGEMGGYGKIVIVEHEGGYTSRYGHNSRLLVQKGQDVDPDTTIAESGATGTATGPHLHFEIRRNESALDPISVPWANSPVRK